MESGKLMSQSPNGDIYSRHGRNSVTSLSIMEIASRVHLKTMALDRNDGPAFGCT